MFFGFPHLITQFYVGLAVEGAAARLGRPGCQDLFDDFTDPSGQRLSTTLAASGEESGRGLRGCYGSTMTGTRNNAAPARRWRSHSLALGSFASVGLQFRNRFRRYCTNTEILMIHEFLHTLGLGENPPTSQAITEQVEVQMRALKNGARAGLP